MLGPQSLEKVRWNLGPSERFDWTQQYNLMWLLDTEQAHREIKYTMIVATITWVVLTMVAILILRLQE